MKAAMDSMFGPVYCIGMGAVYVVPRAYERAGRGAGRAQVLATKVNLSPACWDGIEKGG